MGNLQEVKVVRLHDGETYQGMAWSRDDGTFECWWYEDGLRAHYLFFPDGRQIGKTRYQLKLQQ